ncbi:hypothetical protein QUA30_08195 [Microcoleus sp. Pol14C2]
MPDSLPIPNSQFPIPNSQFGNLKAVWQYAQQRMQAVQSHVT